MGRRLSGRTTPGDLYMFVAEGIYRSEDEIPGGLIDLSSGNNGSSNRPLYGGEEGYNKLTANQKANSLRIQPGDVKWKDVNGDGIIDNYDMVKVGNTVPKWTGGINTSVTWKDLTLSARFDYALGFKAVGGKPCGSCLAHKVLITPLRKPTTPGHPKIPVHNILLMYGPTRLGKRNYCRQSSMFAYNGNYLSFREIALSYNLPSNRVRKAGLGSVMLSVTGQNLGYLTEAKHLFSPEKTDNNGGYPLPRTVILGVNVSF